MNIKPLSNNVVIEPVEEEEEEKKTDAGIIIPDTANKKEDEQPAEGKVVAVGPGKMNEAGERTEMEVKVGDTVLFNEGFSPTKFKSDGKEYVLVEEDRIYGIIQD